MSVNVYEGDVDEYKKNPLYKHREPDDYTDFYVTTSICTILLFTLLILNAFFCWCSKHKHYWQDSNTGNRWLIPVWTKTPHQQPPLDLTELEDAYVAPRPVYHSEDIDEEQIELRKRESDL
ncbi:uncharacterized protein LOC111049190 [Nilaparvata lugens]|uniref:uncharacterized protein LOC111049190 n=1 Tax=Nilaparvata lugens TaxID=108931 RepID=UPI000B993243|nr:uncharacterized protein LOC111049190 [Nilaparvata lugens]